MSKLEKKRSRKQQNVVEKLPQKHRGMSSLIQQDLREVILRNLDTDTYHHMWAAISWLGYKMGGKGFLKRVDGFCGYMPAHEGGSLFPADYDPHTQFVLCEDGNSQLYKIMTPKIPPPEAYRTWKGF